MGFLFYNIYSNRVKSAAKQNLESIAELNANSIDVYFKEVINSIYTSAIDNDISNTLKDTDQKNYYRNMKLLRKELSNLTISNSNIRNVILISKLYNINLHTNSEEMIDFNSQTILDIIKSTYSSMYIKIKFLPLKKSDYMYTKGSADDLIVYFPIRDLQNREETLGIVLFQYNYQKLLETCSRSKIKYNNIIYLVDENEQPIITINNTGLEKIPIYSELKKSGNYLLVGSFIDSVSWKLVFAIDLKDLSKETIVVKKLATTIILISIIATILISISLGLKLTKSLNSISNNMYLFGTGDLSLRINENFATQELKILSNGFNEMADKIQTLINEAYSLEMKQKDAQIKASEPAMPTGTIGTPALTAM